MNRRLISRPGGAVLTLALLGSTWFFLAPVALGGSTTYVATSGVSMQPRFHSGDLALVRSASDYGVGEIVAYHSRMLHTIVLHRIVARDRDRYVFKGDNNSFLDPEHPTRSQLVGKLWLHLPGIGATLRTPRMGGLLAALAALLLAGGTVGVSRRRRRSRRHAEKSTTPIRRRLDARAIPAGLAIATTGLVACLALGALAYTRPAEGPAVAAATYTQTGTFSYTAQPHPGAVYPQGHALTGDPLFTRLIDTAHVQFHYHLISQFPHALTGSTTLEAEIASSIGWKRTLELQPASSFTGDDAVTRGTLHLHAIERLLRRVEAETGTSGGATYTLTLIPHVRVRGKLANVNLTDTFTPHLAFTLDPLQLQPQLPDPNTPTQTPGARDPLAPSRGGAVKTTHTTARTLSFKAVGLAVTRARVLATTGAAVALAALLAFALLALRGRTADDSSRIEARYRDLIVPVARSDRRSYDEIVELTSIETLARLAERYDRLILHEQTPLGHSYRIADDGILYIYLIGDAAGLLPHIATVTKTPEPPLKTRRSPRWRRRQRATEPTHGATQ
jgi:signal peptidase I